MSASLLIAVICLAVWLYLLLGRAAFWKTDYRLPEEVPSPAHWPDITVVIPARNEADMLEHTLPCLLAHDYPGAFRIILVDDHSEDETAATAVAIAVRMGVSDRLSVVNATALPNGWKSKVWAMQRGIEQMTASGCSSRYILFTDADIAYDPGALRRLVAHAETQNGVLTSLMVRLRCVSMAERWLIPAFVYFFGLIYPFRWVHDPRRSMAAAAGGCMLVRAEALRRAGGLERIRGALIDDCALARLLKIQGKIWLGLTQDIHSLRAYPKFTDIRAMVARTAYDQLAYSPLRLLAAIAGLLLVYVSPVMLTIFARGAAQGIGLACGVCLALSFLPMLRFYDRSPLAGFTLPAIAAAYMGFTFDSAWQYYRGRGGMWKGRAQAKGVLCA